MKKLLSILLLLAFTGQAFAAFTERYVTVTGAGAHDGTSEADAWSFAEMISAAPAAGVRVNVKAGTYSVGAYTLGAGTVSAPFVIRGYNSTIGDLDAQGRNADGTLNTTSMPDITITAAWVPSPYSTLQNLDITAALSAAILQAGANDFVNIISCNILNSQNNAAAACFTGDDYSRLVNSDFYCSGAAHAIVVDIDASPVVVSCRFRGTANVTLLDAREPVVLDSLFWGNSTGIGVFTVNYNGVNNAYVGNTFYGLNVCLNLPNNTPSGTHQLWMNNHVTDCSIMISNAHSATASVGLIELHNRTRDVTTLLVGMESIAAGAVTTDTGGAETDFTDAGAGNFRLISAAPGKATALPAYKDIGAYQREEPAGGGGGEHSATFIGP